MSSALKHLQRQTFEREEKRRLEKIIFPVESPKLLSCAETGIYCPGSGFDGNDSCGDELDPDDTELCKSCRRIEDEHYHRRRLVEEGIEPEVWYPHLTDTDPF